MSAHHNLPHDACLIMIANALAEFFIQRHAASLDVLHKYFTNAQMPVVSSTYWNMIHGTEPVRSGRTWRACKLCKIWAGTWLAS